MTISLPACLPAVDIVAAGPIVTLLHRLTPLAHSAHTAISGIRMLI